MNMLGLRDLVLIAQTPSSLHNQQNQPISSDHHPNLPLPSSSSSALSVGLGIFPLLTTTTPPHHQDSNFWNLKMCQPQQVMIMNSTSKRVEEKEDEKIKNLMIEENSNGGDEFKVCLDCGNRAKKDCSFKRCRTCCKGRGFDCSTHVKSTWVPASLRRDRKMVLAETGYSDGGGGGVSSGTKRQRILVSSSHNAATSHSSSSIAATRSLSLDITSSCHQDARFKQSLPRYVRAPAVFKCHRVSAIGNGEDELAYLATVNISGHVFKGFLYDQGIDAKNETKPCVSELQLGSNGSGKSYRECSSSAIEVPTSAYPASAC
ncbi:short internode related sequence [Trifolium pratense]|uniref:Short internode related sequence n=1 Tax=Trifolium pratense TaxID=57577 RepID=A0A2K3PM19_TRIPR|nr:protein LATERAL ROOT PRIMORDIUM 1-like [Trifolium pratense]XP_045799494.1 protein LATERAL ROOT PRIMORDIUM 1-like [Trifolium pratense]PNY16320.1 short internode related sequence [Trifolium pratense]